VKTQPIRPARIVFDDRGQALAPDFNDRYHPAVGGLAQARHVFLQGNGLPGRWAGREHFTVLELGFGLGVNFLATWQAWRQDPRRPRWLHYVGLDLHPPEAEALARVHAGLPGCLQPDAAALRAAWPAATANLHARDLEGGAVRLLLGWGDAAALLPGLRLAADAVYLDGFAPGRAPQALGGLWSVRTLQSLARRLAPGATAATWCAARALRDGLTAAGFEVQTAPGIGGKREITLARHAPRWTPPPLPDGRPRASESGARDAVVVGAGIAGAATAQALAALGWSVTVLDRHPQPAAEASGNAAGLFHGTVNPDDGPYARLFRAAALHAAPAVAAAAVHGVPAHLAGLLRLQPCAGDEAATLQAMQALLQRLGLPSGYVQALSAAEASGRAGVPLSAPAWFYPGGGWVSPGSWVRDLLDTPGVTYRGGVQVQRLEPADAASAGGAWRLIDTDGRCQGQVPLVVLAGGVAGAGLGSGLQGLSWPLRCTRGQVSGWTGEHHLRCAVAGDGYALPMDGVLWCGATRQDWPGALVGEAASAGGTAGHQASALELTEEDHRHNLARLRRLTGLQPPTRQGLLGRAGLRLHADDRLPLAGALPDLDAAWPRPQARLAPRHAGLFVLGALGARGLTLAPLLARLVAAQATGTPWPLEQDLADAVDPVRWRVRAARR
jgi:tRNA 5-methylaminomethyl-2-thiouridine biosynthesis bifunctional protein